MTVDDNVRDEKPQYGINREAAKISALSSGKMDEYEYLIDEQKCHLIKVLEQAKFTSPLGKAF